MTVIEEIPYSPAVPTALGGWINRNGPVVGVFAAIFAGWEVAVRTLGMPEYILPSPSAIVDQDRLVLAAPALERLRDAAGNTARLWLSVVVAIPLAIAVVYSGIFERVAFPFMVSLQTIPKVALAPILVMWLGYGIMPKVMVAFLISFFPIVINSVIGMRSAEKEMIYLVQSMGASELTTFIKIRLPKALPSIFGGLKVGMGQAVVGATVGEFIAAEAGSRLSAAHLAGAARYPASVRRRGRAVALGRAAVQRRRVGRAARVAVEPGGHARAE